jgi:hypothetical protein
MEDIPKHNNSVNAGRLCYWSGSDRKDVWLSNMKDPNHYEFFKKNRWDNEYAIEYNFNSHGFRCKEFDQSPAYLALGCSFTEGVGIPIEQTWPTLLAEQINQPILNLGVGGSSLDTCFRLLDYYIDKLNILGVFVLEPPPDRFEIFESNTPFTFTPNYDKSTVVTGEKELYQLWITAAKNTSYNIRKNNLAMKQLCDEKNIPITSIPLGITYQRTDFSKYPERDLARDLLHNGIIYQKSVADIFYSDMQPK